MISKLIGYLLPKTKEEIEYLKWVEYRKCIEKNEEKHPLMDENGKINEEEFLKEAKNFLNSLVLKTPANSLLEVAIKLIDEKNLKLNNKENEIN